MRNIFVVSMLALAICGLSACGSSNGVTKAAVFTGGAITEFAGANGNDNDSQLVARRVMDLRTFDFVNENFRLANGLVYSASLGGGSFGQGEGTMILGVQNAAALLFIDSSDPSVSDVQLTGEFDHQLAQRAIDTPGVSFVAAWRLSFTHNNRDRVITFTQNMTGGQFTNVL